jgi:hypothetical protein
MSSNNNNSSSFWSSAWSTLLEAVTLPDDRPSEPPPLAPWQQEALQQQQRELQLLREQQMQARSGTQQQPTVLGGTGGNNYVPSSSSSTTTTSSFSQPVIQQTFNNNQSMVMGVPTQNTIASNLPSSSFSSNTSLVQTNSISLPPTATNNTVPPSNVSAIPLYSTASLASHSRSSSGNSRYPAPVPLVQGALQIQQQQSREMSHQLLQQQLGYTQPLAQNPLSAPPIIAPISPGHSLSPSTTYSGMSSSLSSSSSSSSSSFSSTSSSSSSFSAPPGAASLATNGGVGQIQGPVTINSSIPLATLSTNSGVSSSGLSGVIPSSTSSSTPLTPFLSRTQSTFPSQQQGFVPPVSPYQNSSISSSSSSSTLISTSSSAPPMTTATMTSPAPLLGSNLVGSAPPVAFTSPQTIRAIGPSRNLSSGTSSSSANTRYVPVEDGFVTTAGNKERGAKYGNATGAHPLTTHQVTAGVIAGYGGQQQFNQIPQIPIQGSQMPQWTSPTTQ